MPNKTPSDSIRIFPSSNRSSNSGHYTDNFVTEYNLSSIINKLLLQGYDRNGAPTSLNFGEDPNNYTANVNGFVISDSFSEDADFDFNINGYFISVRGADIINTAGTDKGQSFVWFDTDVDKKYICACIQINTSADEKGLYRLEGKEGESGTSFSLTSKGNIIALPLLINSGGTYSVVPTSKLRLTNFAIDDGEL